MSYVLWVYIYIYSWCVRALMQWPIHICIQIYVYIFTRAFWSIYSHVLWLSYNGRAVWISKQFGAVILMYLLHESVVCTVHNYYLIIFSTYVIIHTNSATSTIILYRAIRIVNTTSSVSAVLETFKSYLNERKKNIISFNTQLIMLCLNDDVNRLTWNPDVQCFFDKVIPMRRIGLLIQSI